MDFMFFTSVFIYLSDFAISRDGPETDENKLLINLSKDSAYHRVWKIGGGG